MSKTRTWTPPLRGSSAARARAVVERVIARAPFSHPSLVEHGLDAHVVSALGVALLL
jgi:hypothetical protein